MLRSLYCCLIRLHPPAFRRRFADEMLSIFDHTTGKRAAFSLLVDVLISLARQWGLRPGFWHEISPAALHQPDPQGLPSFCTLDPFRPRAAAVVQGLLLSLAVFGTTCYAIRYSWIHVLHVSIPEVQFDRPARIPEATSSSTGASLERRRVPPRSTNGALVPPPTPPPATRAFKPGPLPATKQLQSRATGVFTKANPTKTENGAPFSNHKWGTTDEPQPPLEAYAGTYVV